MRVVLWGSYAKAEIAERIGAMEGIELTVTEDRAATIEALPGAEALLLAGNLYDAELAAALRERAPELRWIQVLTAGYDQLERHGVPAGVLVSNAGGAWAVSVAEHAMALLLALVKGVPGIVENQRGHGWDRGFSARMGSLDGMTLLVVGFGNIGRATARRARAFGMRVIGMSRTARPDPDADEVCAPAALRDALGRADAILLSAPLTEATRHLLNRETLAACKPGAFVVNIARGGLIDQAALAEALADGRLGGAGVDVTDPEPLPPDDRLWDAPNLIVSPHVAGASGARGRARVAAVAADNLARFVKGETPHDLVRIGAADG